MPPFFFPFREDVESYYEYDSILDFLGEGANATVYRGIALGSAVQASAEVHASQTPRGVVSFSLASSTSSFPSSSAVSSYSTSYFYSSRYGGSQSSATMPSSSGTTTTRTGTTMTTSTPTSWSSHSQVSPTVSSWSGRADGNDNVMSHPSHSMFPPPHSYGHLPPPPPPPPSPHRYPKDPYRRASRTRMATMAVEAPLSRTVPVGVVDGGSPTTVSGSSHTPTFSSSSSSSSAASAAAAGAAFPHVQPVLHTLTTGSVVALKIFEKKKLDTEPRRQEVWNEVQVARGIHHPNCTELLDFFETPTLVVLVFSYWEGSKELFFFLQQHPLLPEPLVQAIMYQLLQALGYLHEKLLVVHRDVKPENILLAQKPNGQLHVLLVDFGLSRVIPRVASASSSSSSSPSPSSLAATTLTTAMEIASTRSSPTSPLARDEEWGRKTEEEEEEKKKANGSGGEREGTPDGIGEMPVVHRFSPPLPHRTAFTASSASSSVVTGTSPRAGSTPKASGSADEEEEVEEEEAGGEGELGSPLSSSLSSSSTPSASPLCGPHAPSTAAATAASCLGPPHSSSSSSSSSSTTSLYPYCCTRHSLPILSCREPLSPVRSHVTVLHGSLDGPLLPSPSTTPGHFFASSSEEGPTSRHPTQLLHMPPCPPLLDEAKEKKKKKKKKEKEEEEGGTTAAPSYTEDRTTTTTTPVPSWETPVAPNTHPKQPKNTVQKKKMGETPPPPHVPSHRSQKATHGLSSGHLLLSHPHHPRIENEEEAGEEEEEEEEDDDEEEEAARGGGRMDGKWDMTALMHTSHLPSSPLLHVHALPPHAYSLLHASLQEEQKEREGRAAEVESEIDVHYDEEEDDDTYLGPLSNGRGEKMVEVEEEKAAVEHHRIPLPSKKARDRSEANERQKEKKFRAHGPPEGCFLDDGPCMPSSPLFSSVPPPSSPSTSSSSFFSASGMLPSPHGLSKPISSPLLSYAPSSPISPFHHCYRAALPPSLFGSSLLLPPPSVDIPLPRGGDEETTPLESLGPCGTLKYAAPEIIRCLVRPESILTSPQLFSRTDVYSAGQVMYLMLCGRLPFMSSLPSLPPAGIGLRMMNPKRMLLRKMELGPRFDDPRELWSQIPSSAMELNAALLRYEPSERYGAVEALQHHWFDGVRDELDKMEPMYLWYRNACMAEGDVPLLSCTV